MYIPKHLDQASYYSLQFLSFLVPKFPGFNRLFNRYSQHIDYLEVIVNYIGLFDCRILINLS